MGPFYGTWVQNARYDTAGRMSSLQYLSSAASGGSYTTETMGYNANGQLGSLNFSGGVSGGIQYNYSATQNNGQITGVTDSLSGETIAYQYL